MPAIIKNAMLNTVPLIVLKLIFEASLKDLSLNIITGSTINSFANKYIKEKPLTKNNISLPGYLAISPVIKSGIDKVGMRDDWIPIFKIGIKTRSEERRVGKER